MRCFAVLALPLILMATSIAKAQADIVTYYFNAVLSSAPGAAFQMPVGTTGTGWYKFDTNTIASIGPNSADNLFAIYGDAIVDFHVDFGTYGAASGNIGSIFIGDPVQTTGSFNFLSDIYQAFASVDDGIVVPGSVGERRSASASIFLQDLDMVGLSSEVLSATPPDLAAFKDNLTPRPLPDTAELQMNFSFPFGGFNTVSFELTNLTAVPEPSSALFIVSGTAVWLIRRRRLRTSGKGG